MNAPHVLVTGGAGFIGSHMAKYLALHGGYRVTMLDNLSLGCAPVERFGHLVRGETGDAALLHTLFAAHRFDAVLHFAGSSQVGESMLRPEWYLHNNVACTQSLLQAMQVHGVRKLVFASSAAVYGAPVQQPIAETASAQPLNPYGQSKWLAEQAVAAAGRHAGLQAVCLRYFNVAGADPQGELGEMHEPETHLIPRLLRVAAGQEPYATLHGNDYATPDGTCIRDFLHVWDVCAAHHLALQHLLADGFSATFNLGSGSGFSVHQVFKAVEHVTGRKLPVQLAARRPGDPDRLVADNRHILAQWGWQPGLSDLYTQIAHAWQWHKRQTFLRG